MSSPVAESGRGSKSTSGNGGRGRSARQDRVNTPEETPSFVTNTCKGEPAAAAIRATRRGPRSSTTVPLAPNTIICINGTPLMQMMVFDANGTVVEERGPLRVARIAAAAGSPLQVLVTNEGVSSGVFTLSCRADRPRPPLPDVDLDPLPDSATGELVSPPRLDRIDQ